MTNVLLVEDERLASEMLCHYIKEAGDRYHLVEAIRNADDAELYCHRTQVDAILMDVCTAGNASGLDAAKRIKEQFPHTKIVIITSAPEYRFIDKAKGAGVESFWYKDADSEELISVLDRTVAGESIYPENAPSVDFGFADSSVFTDKELETLYWLVKVGSISIISQNMGISVDGVNKHIRDLKEKTGIRNTNQLAIAARGSRLVLPDY